MTGRVPGAAVGPVLSSGRVAEAVLDALREDNPGLAVLDRGAYVRVSAPAPCVLSRAAVERHLGAPFRLPADLERIMPAFEGTLSMTEDGARWERPGAPPTQPSSQAAR